MEEHSIADGIPEEPARVMYEFDVPDSLRGTAQIKKLGLVELTADEELMATKRIGTEIARLAFELTKESLRMVNDRAVATFDGSSDRAWARMSPKLRNLVVGAYASIHNADAAEAAAFNKSRKVHVG